ncbi:MAG: hypothetical protein KME06_18660 [Kastovskya adunca ATA6-11-RM4]|jgi:hypothetical protein|nr:hypothetical protein [Kastovskya adunca ATA6-11-RM4]
MIYLAKASSLGNKIICKECGRTPQIEELESKPFSSKTVFNKSHHLSNFQQSLTFSNRHIVLAAVTLASLLGIVVYRPTILPQQAQLPTLPVSLQSALKPSRSPVSLPNGTDIIPPQDSEGLGALKIVNGMTDDAAIKLVDSVSGKTRRFVYVQANQKVTIEGISPCNCILKFTLGKDWEQTKQSFLQNPSFSQFSKPLDFREIEKESGVEWMKYEATLHPVPHGSARTKPIKARDFED